MIEVKDKIITVESLSALHDHNKNSYMSASNPTGNGVMTMNGSASFSGDIMIGSNIKLVPSGDALSIIFLDEEATEETIEENQG